MNLVPNREAPVWGTQQVSKAMKAVAAPSIGVP